jgi:hypothetical protein
VFFFDPVHSDGIVGDVLEVRISEAEKCVKDSYGDGVDNLMLV